MYALLAILLILTLAAFLKITLVLEYGEDGFCGFVKILFIKIKFPAKSTKKHKKAKKSDKKPAEDKGKKKSGSLKTLKEAIKPVLAAVGDFIHRITIEELTADITVSTGNAFTTAMMYGGSATGVGLIMPIINNNLKVLHKRISVKADFEEKESKIYLFARLYTRIWHAVVLGVTVLYKYLKIKNNNSKTERNKKHE